MRRALNRKYTSRSRREAPWNQIKERLSTDEEWWLYVCQPRRARPTSGWEYIESTKPQLCLVKDSVLRATEATWWLRRTETHGLLTQSPGMRPRSFNSDEWRSNLPEQKRFYPRNPSPVRPSPTKSYHRDKSPSEWRVKGSFVRKLKPTQRSQQSQ